MGTATIGSFSSINWGNGSYYLGIELNTGSGYVAMGTTQLLSVPYALYANTAGNSQVTTPNLASVLAVNNGANNLQIKNVADPTDLKDAATKQYVDSKIPDGTNVGDNLIWNGTNWIVSSANTTAQLPQLTTTIATEITLSTANSGGTITSDGGFSIISKGVAWSTSPNPTINDNFTSNGSGATSFQSALNNLLPGTSYYYRAYATNTVGTGYGMSFSYSNSFINAPIPTRNPANVLSVFSDTYTNVPVSYYNGFWTPGSTTGSADFSVNGNNILNYTTFNYVGIAFANPTLNATAMTRVHFNMYIPNNVPPNFDFLISIEDWGANQVDNGGDDTRQQIFVPASQVQANTWITIDAPITLVNRNNIGLIIMENINGSSLSNFYLDNIYFYN